MNRYSNRAVQSGAIGVSTPAPAAQGGLTVAGADLRQRLPIVGPGESASRIK
jgi:hypothetical protein